MSDKYFIKTKYHPEIEVTKSQFIEAEISAGFYSKFENEVATYTFGDSKTGLSGRIVREYEKDDE